MATAASPSTATGSYRRRRSPRRGRPSGSSSRRATTRRSPRGREPVVDGVVAVLDDSLNRAPIALAVVALPGRDVVVEPPVTSLARSDQRQLPSDQLARRGARQLVHELDPLRHLVAGERPPQCDAQLGGARPASPRKTTTAVTASCHSGSARPTAAASATAGWRSSTSSTSAGSTFSPPVTIMSPSRSVDVEKAVVVDPARGRRCAASRPRRRRRGDRRALDPGSRRPGSAGGWSAAAGRPTRRGSRPRPARASSPATRSRSSHTVWTTVAPRRSASSSTSRGTGPPPTSTARSGSRSTSASSRRASWVGDERDQRDPVALERRRDPVGVEAVVDDRRRAVDDAAHHDREPADVVQRAGSRANGPSARRRG